MAPNNNFKFINFKVTKLLYNENKQFNDKSSSKQVEITPDFQINYNKNNEKVFVDISIKIENSNTPFLLHVVLTGIFEIAKDIETQELDKLVNINMAAILFPFLRQVVADITTKAGFAPLLLPPLIFSEEYKTQNKKT